MTETTMNTTANPCHGNGTSACTTSGSSAGLSAGLTIFFLLLVIVAAVLVYRYHGIIREKMQFGHRTSPKKEEYTETPEVEPHQYTGLSRQSLAQTPIYENLTTRTAGYERRPQSQGRSCSEPEEDVYLQCDSPDDAIYNNDPACNLSILPDTQDEDVYIMPDS